MHCLALTYMMFLLSSVLATLPAPRNASVVSVNFHNILRWDPGPGTPPGTQYIVHRRVLGKKRKVRVNVTTATSIELKLQTNKHYNLTVQASFNQSHSPESTLVFCPYQDTKIGPPVLSLAGCGDCIKINISLPEADRRSGINDIQQYYSAQFRILCKRGKETVVDYFTKKLNNIIPNLNPGVEYCVQVQTKTIQNKNTEPSAWECIYTSIIDAPHREPLVLGAGAALLILVLGVLTAFIFCLHYTGFLCTLKALPTSIIILRHGYILTPDGTTPDPISIISEKVTQRSQNNPTVAHTASVDEEEEEEEEEEGEGEEEIIDYMDRGAQRSLGQSLCWSSSTVTGKSEAAASGDSGRERLIAVEPEVTRGGREDSQEETQTEVLLGKEKQEEETKQNDDVFDSSSNVNLFSVTIAALSVGEEEEQYNGELLSSLVKETEALRNTDSQTDTEASVQNSKEDCTKSWYESNDIKTSDTGHEQVDEAEGDHEDAEEEEDDEDDEDTESGYMAHT